MMSARLMQAVKSRFEGFGSGEMFLAHQARIAGIRVGPRPPQRHRHLDQYGRSVGRRGGDTATSCGSNVEVY
ncbi:hypothetical protein MTO96_045034 [Rhipicephalus appendiculatus]